ncbi:zinc ABC transporter substrate-binding protein [Streptobacillus felis]|uniref:Zinc ABC transporter substrate-binding protein n=1 Tax=Streptobacillus felis TaxID=1384509 RepID=A0A7Z0PEG2_9FUSO|nr:zinc ABC transporter substrate-binding protein [Streptobacillus felis]NYV27731.1 zinc ABC transporter substrate-binding protein [Streptobacillus felis]
MKRIILGLTIFFSLISNAAVNKKIVTSNQVSYTLATKVLSGTDINVVSAVDAYTDMYKQKVTFQNLNNKSDIFSDAGVVVTFSKILPDDFLYEQARRYNIGVIEIDLGYSYRDNNALMLSNKINEDGSQNRNVWLDFSNIYKMIDILSSDLVEIYPESSEIIVENSEKLKLEFLNMFNEFTETIFNSSEDIGVIYLGDSEMDFLLDSLEIYHQNLPYNANIDLIKKTMSETGIKKIVSSKTLNKSLRDKLIKEGIEFVKLDLGNIPLDKNDDEIMDIDGYINIVKTNLDRLKKLFLK